MLYIMYLWIPMIINIIISIPIRLSLYIPLNFFTSIGVKIRPQINGILMASENTYYNALYYVFMDSYDY